MGVFADVEAFVLERRGRGQLEGDTGEPGPLGCGVRDMVLVPGPA